jgi:hypothetical protein
MTFVGALALAERRSPDAHPSYGLFFQNLDHFEFRPYNPKIHILDICQI